MARLSSLPSHLRQQIFRETGLVRKCPISFQNEKGRLGQVRMAVEYPWRFGQHRTDYVAKDYNCVDDAIYQDCHGLLVGNMLCADIRSYFCENHSDTTSPPSRYTCWHEPLPVALLSTCKQFHQEATVIMFGENVFLLNCSDASSMDPFRNLSHNAQASLRKLFIISSLEDRQFSSSAILSGFGRPLQDTFNVLSSRVPPGSLSLCLYMPAQNELAAGHILKTMQGLPKLRDICINLGPIHGSTAHAALNTACQDFCVAENHGTSKASFPFQRLPVELQSIVLSHTGLVVTNGSDNTSRKRRDARGILIDQTGTPRPLYTGCCGTCTTSGFPGCWCTGPGTSEEPFMRSRVIECRTGRKPSRCEAGRYSSTCSCRRLPCAIFQTSQALNHLGTRVFWGMNQFYVEGDSARMWRSLSPLIENGRFRLVRDLCLDCGWLPYKCDGPKDWRALLGVISKIQKHGHKDLTIKVLFNTKEPADLEEWGPPPPHAEPLRLQSFRVWFDGLAGKNVSLLLHTSWISLENHDSRDPCAYPDELRMDDDVREYQENQHRIFEVDESIRMFLWKEHWDGTITPTLYDYFNPETVVRDEEYWKIGTITDGLVE